MGILQKCYPATNNYKKCPLAFFFFFTHFLHINKDDTTPSPPIVKKKAKPCCNGP